MPIIRTVVENSSRYPIEVVWENAQDLEHVSFVHRSTNKSFELLHVTKGTETAYGTMIYRSTRKFFFWRIRSFGFRTIIGENNLHQLEIIPALGITTALNSLLYATSDPQFPTLMRDEVVMEIPKIFYPLRRYLCGAVGRHAKIQCAEDEPYRARRTELQSRGINFPYSIFFESTFARLTQHFQFNGKDTPHAERSHQRPIDAHSAAPSPHA